LLAAEIVSRMDAGIITALCYFSIFFAGGMIFSVARTEVSEIKKIVYQSIPIFLLSGILSSFTGSILQLKIFQLVLLPSLFVLIPSFLQVGGSISCILASRLSSSLHCGLIAPEAKPSGDVLLNFWTILLLMLLIGPLLGFFSHALSIFIGFQSPGILTMVLITSLSGMLLALIANISTFYTTILSFHAGLDPDNVVIPAMTPLMDFAGICTLIFVFSIFGLV
jgi:mgtE-like transporter